MRGKLIKIIRSIIFVLILLMLVSIYSFATEAAAGEKEPITLVLADTGGGPNDPLTVSGIAWKEAIEELSNGEIIVNYFSQHQLGSERDLWEGVGLGTIDMTIGSTGYAGNLVPELAVINLPFLFLNRKHCEEVELGPLGEELVSYIDKAEGANLKGLALGGAGWRMPMNKKRAIKTTADFKGLKFRTMEVPMHLDTYRAMGAKPIPVASAEVYTALQLGTVDGQEMPPSMSYARGFHEVSKYLTTLPVFLNGDVYIINKEKYESLSSEHQKVLRDSAKIALLALNQSFEDNYEKAVNAIEEYGLEVYRISVAEMQPFIDSSQVVWDKYLEQFPKRIKEIALEIKKLGEKY